MAHLNVQPGTPPGYCGAIADDLRRIADALAAVEHLELPEPRYVHLHIQPGGKTDDEVIAAVNALGQAVNGKPGKPVRMSGGSYHFVAEVPGGPVSFNAYREISRDRAWRMDPDYQPDERDRELERLRAENERLRFDRAAAPRELLAIAPSADGGVAFALAPAGVVVDPVARAKAVELTEAVAADPTGQLYGRGDEGADPQPSGARVAPHFESGRDDALVEDGESGSVCNGARPGFEADCGIDGGHGPHPLGAH